MSSTRTAVRRRSHERRAATERSILDAVESLLADRSFRDVAVEDVMTVAGLGRTAFYRYFPDLEAVLLRLMSEVAGEIAAAARIWLRGEDPKAMGAAGVALASVYERRGRLLLAFADAAAAGPELEGVWGEAVGGFVAMTARRIQELGEAGIADVDDAFETARALVWMTERYLLEVFGRQAVKGITTQHASDVLGVIWQRALFPG